MCVREKEDKGSKKRCMYLVSTGSICWVYFALLDSLRARSICSAFCRWLIFHHLASRDMFVAVERRLWHSRDHLEP